MYATVVFGEGQVSGKRMSHHVMLTGGRGCNQQADTAANNMSVVSTFTPALFSPAGVHIPYTAQPDLLLLLLLCDLLSPLSGCTEIVV